MTKCHLQGFGRPEIGRTPLALPRTTSGNESGIQRAVGNRLAQGDEGLEDPLAPISTATEQEHHRRG